jgi:FkbM family methyltransferase
MPVPGYKLHVHPGDPLDALVVNEIWVENVYQIHRGLFKDTGVLLDLGANIGTLAVWATTLNDGKHPHVSVVAVEPHPENLDLLRRNITSNPCNNTAYTIIEMAVSDREKTAWLDPGEHARTMLIDRPAEGRVKAHTISLDQLFDYPELAHGCDVAKIDVEGSEYPIIEGASLETLRKIGYIAIEFHSTDDKTFGKFVTKLCKVFNFHCIGTPERGGYIYGYRYDL